MLKRTSIRSCKWDTKIATSAPTRQCTFQNQEGNLFLTRHRTPRKSGNISLPSASAPPKNMETHLPHHDHFPILKISKIFQKFLKKGLTFEKRCAIMYRSQRSGCGAAGSALPWGGRGRKFKSCHSDQNEGS